jgi:hypothetical protein
MAHGGRRPGAGRNRKVALAPLRIGAACGAELVAKWQKAARAVLDNDRNSQRVEAAREGIKAAVATAKHTRHIRPPRETFEKLAQEHRDEIDEACIDRERPNKFVRLVSYRVPRPKGVRQEILKIVAKRFSVSTGTVDRYWKRYRQIQKRAAAAEENRCSGTHRSSHDLPNFGEPLGMVRKRESKQAGRPTDSMSDYHEGPEPPGQGGG